MFVQYGCGVCCVVTDACDNGTCLAVCGAYILGL